MLYREHRRDKKMKERVKQVRRRQDTSAQAQSRMNMRRDGREEERKGNEGGRSR